MQGFDPHKVHIEVAHPYLTMTGLYLGGFTGMFSETSLNIALPQLTEAFGVDVAVMQWMVVGYMLVIGIVLPFASLLMKWFSVRKLTLFALGAFFVGSLISGFAPSFEVMLAGRLVQGVGTGLVLPMMFAVVLEVFAPVKIGAAMGLTALIIMFAPAIGPTLSGIILGALSWRFIFFTFAVVLAVAMVFAAKFLVNPYELTRPRVDALSCALSCLGFGGVVLGAGLASLYGWTSVEVVSALVIGMICIATYVYRQLHMEIPMLDVRVFCQQGYRVGMTLVMLNFGITLSAMYLLPQYIQSGMLLPVAMAGMLMLPGGVMNCIVSVIAGGLYDRIGARIPARAGFALSIAGTVMFLFATPDSSIAYVICAHVILMIGVPLAMSPSQTSALNSLPHERGRLHHDEHPAAGARRHRNRRCHQPAGHGPGGKRGKRRSRVHQRRALGLRVHAGAGSCRAGGIDAAEEAQLRRRSRARRRRCASAWRGACKRPAGRVCQREPCRLRAPALTPQAEGVQAAKGC